MRVQILDLVVIILRDIHPLSVEHSKCNALLGLGKYVRSHAMILDVLCFLRAREFAVGCQENCGFIVLEKDIVLESIPLCFNKVLS